MMHLSVGMPFSVAILAGGENSRFGRKPKALMPWEDSTLLNRYIRIFSPLSDDVFLVTNHPDLYSAYPLNKFPDALPGKGPLSGIHSALLNARFPWVLITACDMPFLTPEVVQWLVSEIPPAGNEVLVPAHRGGAEPMFSLWPKDINLGLDAWLQHAEDLKIMHFLHTIKQIKMLPLPPAFNPTGLFFNINSQSEWRKAVDGHRMNPMKKDL